MPLPPPDDVVAVIVVENFQRGLSAVVEYLNCCCQSVILTVTTMAGMQET